MAYSDGDQEGQAALDRIAALARQRAAVEDVRPKGHVFMHPNSGSKIVGVRLEPGATLKAGDVYPCPDGSWKAAGRLEGQKVDSITMCWIRPSPAPDQP